MSFDYLTLTTPLKNFYLWILSWTSIKLVEVVPLAEFLSLTNHKTSLNQSLMTAFLFSSMSGGSLAFWPLLIYFLRSINVYILIRGLNRFKSFLNEYPSKYYLKYIMSVSALGFILILIFSEEIDILYLYWSTFIS